MADIETLAPNVAGLGVIRSPVIVDVPPETDGSAADRQSSTELRFLPARIRNWDDPEGLGRTSKAQTFILALG